ncbi:MAG TPA: ribonuclease P protein component [Devosia sp.]
MTMLRQLRKRAEFVRAARGNRAGRSAFSLQAIGSEGVEPGVGFTVTKKTGNSPERNRIKRRLRAAARACAGEFQPQHDYVLVGRREALGEKFDKLVRDLSSSIVKVHASRAESPRKPK